MEQQGRLQPYSRVNKVYDSVGYSFISLARLSLGVLGRGWLGSAGRKGFILIIFVFLICWLSAISLPVMSLGSSIFILFLVFLVSQSRRLESFEQWNVKYQPMSRLSLYTLSKVISTNT